MTAVRRSILAGLLALSAAGLAACGEAPTGRQQLVLIPTAQLREMGREEHQQVLRNFGGAYADPAVQSYVDAVARRLAKASDIPQEIFTFTVLNSDIANAMALPGGYVYVTRGLLALANNEAELASVLAHEIGHLAARHPSERVSQTIATQIGLAVLATAIDNPGLADLAGLGAQALLQRYSREQEFEADQLGVRYMARAGYDPRAAADMLRTLSRQAAVEAAKNGRSPQSVDEFGIMSSHPRTLERVGRAVEAALEGLPGGRIGREDHLRVIDGMLYGDDPSKGVVRGRVFQHPKLRFAFEVPEGFDLVNTDEAVLARHPSGALIVFDGVTVRDAVDMRDYLWRWAKGVDLGGIEAIEVNGLPAATAAARLRSDRGPVDLRLVAIRHSPDSVYRFMFITPASATEAMNIALRRTTYSFQPLSPREAAAVEPLRIRIMQVRPGDTVESLAARMPNDGLALERFRTLNGLAPGQPVRPGQFVKLVEG